VAFPHVGWTVWYGKTVDLSVGAVVEVAVDRVGVMTGWDIRFSLL